VFRGAFEHGIDAKGRTSLPARFREILAARQEDYVVATQGPSDSLWVFTPTTWNDLAAKVSALPQFDPQVQKFMNAFVSVAHDCKLDAMGRILVPPTLRAFAGLQTDVVWLGAISRMELWDAQRWNVRNQEARQLLNDPAFARRLAELGI